MESGWKPAIRFSRLVQEGERRAPAPLDRIAGIGHVTRMRKHVIRQDVMPPEEEPPLTDYEASLADEIVAGCAELDAGKGIPAEQVWQELGLE